MIIPGHRGSGEGRGGAASSSAAAKTRARCPPSCCYRLPALPRGEVVKPGPARDCRDVHPSGPLTPPDRESTLEWGEYLVFCARHSRSFSSNGQTLPPYREATQAGLPERRGLGEQGNPSRRGDLKAQMKEAAGRARAGAPSRGLQILEDV